MVVQKRYKGYIKEENNMLYLFHVVKN